MQSHLAKHSDSYWLIIVLIAGTLLIQGWDVSYDFEARCGFEDECYNWSKRPTKNFVKQPVFAGERSFFLDSVTEFSPSFSFPLHQIGSNRLIEAEVMVFLPKPVSNALLVVSIESSGNSVFWKAESFQNHIVNTNQWNKVYINALVTQEVWNQKTAIVKVYVWNPNSQHCFIDDLWVGVRDFSRHSLP